MKNILIRYTPNVTVFVILVLWFCWYFFNGGFLEISFIDHPDADSFYCAQTIDLLDNGPLHYNHHPGATVYSGIALLVRVAALFSEPFRQVMTLQEHLPEVLTILNTTTYAGRILAMITTIAIGFVIFLIMKNLVYSFLFAAITALFVSSLHGVLYHIWKIRTESLSLLFFLLGFWGLLKMRTVIRLSLPWVLWTILVGSSFGLAVFSKIQIGRLPANNPYSFLYASNHS